MTTTQTRCIVLSLALALSACRRPPPPAAGPPPQSTLAPWLTPPQAQPPQAQPPQAQPLPAQPPPAQPPPPAVPPQVEVGEPKFIGGGTIPKVEAFLEKMKKKAAQCVANDGPGRTGKMRIQFLVTLRGRAEGVDVLSAKGFSDEARACVRDAFKNQRVGTPTADPTGVQFTYTFK